MRSIVRFGFEQRLMDGSFVPNGIPAGRWANMSTLQKDGFLPGVDFLESAMPTVSERAGYDVRCDLTSHLTAEAFEGPWYYLLRPYANPVLNDAFKCLPSAVSDQVHTGRCRLVIDYAHEGFSERMLQLVYDAISASCIPARNVLLVNGDLNATEFHKVYCSAHGIDDRLDVYPHNIFARQVAEESTACDRGDGFVTWLEAAAERDRPFLFLNFNRRNRLHRLMTVLRIHRRGLLQRGMVSLQEQFEGEDNLSAFTSQARWFKVPHRLVDEFSRDYPSLRRLLPLEVDVNDMSVNHAHSHPKWPYLRSWVSLVSETLFYESSPGQVFVSEKIYKPIINHHPFLLIGDAHTLKAMRDLGYLTFHPHIDESYDAEPDHDRRLEMVLDELERLNALSPLQLVEWFDSLGPVLRHNFARLESERTEPNFSAWDRFGSPST